MAAPSLGQPSIEHPVDVPGGRLVVRDIPGPSPDAPAVVLLHGLGATARLNWGPSFRPLSRHFRVLAFDLRGHGRGLRTRRFTLEDCADDAAAVLEARGVERALAVGYSLGGPVAKLFWQRHRERTAGLVLCATASWFATPGEMRAARVLLPVASGLARVARDRMHRRILGRMLMRVDHPPLRARVKEEFAGHDPLSVVQAVGAGGRYSARAWAGAIDVPTAVLVTRDDRRIPPTRQRELAAAIPEASLHEVAGDHFACIASEAFVPALVEACLEVAERAGHADGRRRSGDAA